MKPWHSDRLLSRTLFLLALLSAASMAFYILVAYRAQFHSDSAMKNLLAGEIIRTFSLFPRHWYYINDIPLLFPHLVIVPLAIVFPNSFALHAVACFVCAILVAGSLYLLYSVSGLRRGEFFLAASLLFTGLSDWFAENIFGQFAYGLGLGGIFASLGLVFLTIRAYNEGSRRALRFWSICLGLLLALTITSGMRGVFGVVIPMLASLGIVLVAPRSAEARTIFRPRAHLYTAALVLAATLLGCFCFYLVSSHVNFRNDASAPHFVSYEELKSNISVFFEGLLAYTAVLPAASQKPVSIIGIITAYRLFWFGLVLLLPFVFLARYRSIQSPYLQFLTVYYCFSFIITLYLYVFSSLPHGVATFRYFIYPCIVAVIMIGYVMREVHIRYGTTGALLLLAACLPVHADSIRRVLGASLQIDSQGHVVQFGTRENQKEALAGVLVSRGLKYGYATFWNAGVVTVFSGGKTRVNAVEIRDNPPVVPQRWLSSEDWYLPAAFHGRTFLLLTEQEYGSLNKAAMDSILGPPQSVESVLGYRIVVYGFNIAERFPSWEGDGVTVDEKYNIADLKADLECSTDEIVTRNGETGFVKMRITNKGPRPFASVGKFPIYLGAHLYTEDLKLKDFHYIITVLPGTLKPGQPREANLVLKPLPPGKYVLEIAIVQGGVAWFGTKPDSTPLRVRLTVS